MLEIKQLRKIIVRSPSDIPISLAKKLEMVGGEVLMLSRASCRLVRVIIGAVEALSGGMSFREQPYLCSLTGTAPDYDMMRKGNKQYMGCDLKNSGW
ncbi:unnamed protein product [Heligmosomoides polygyrus]|uniref:DNA-binding protein n=1 Tax=Heligmosomoides polygyrus TaxID=6339 RepID=A0A183G131_HELPZ|nr:unnamed protein product [Heligmosomoides polygyrus]